MSLIERYIFRRIATVTISALTVTTVLALTTQVLIQVNVLTSSGQSLWTVAKLALFLVPSMVLIALPFALLIGVIHTLRTMNQDTELVILDSAGISLTRKTRPVLLAAGISAAAVMALSVYIEPYGESRMRGLLTEASGNLLAAAVRSGTFTRISDGLFIQIGERLPGGAFSQIYISDRRDEKNSLIYYAKKGQIVDEDGRGLLVVADGEIHQKKANENSVSIIRFDTYTLDTATFASGAGERLKVAKERPTSYLMAPEAADPVFQRAPQSFREEVHRRFSGFLYPVAMVLAAAYFVGRARSNRQDSGSAVTLAILVAVSIRATGFALNGASGANMLAAIMSYLLPILAIGLFTVLIVRDIELGLAGMISRRVDRMMAALEQLRARYAPGRSA